MSEREPNPGKRPLSSAEVAELEEAATKPRRWTSKKVEAKMLEAKKFDAWMLEAKKNDPTLKPSDAPSWRGNPSEQWDMAGSRQPHAKHGNTHQGMGVGEDDPEEPMQINYVPRFNIEDIKETARLLNTNVLRSSDSLIKEVLVSVSTVSLHYWHPHRLIWCNKNVRGPLFLVKRSVVPIYQMVISNRKSAGNTTLDLVDDFMFEAMYPHLKFQHAGHGIVAIKFYQEEELVTVANFLVRKFPLEKNENGAWVCPKIPQQAVVSKASSVWISLQKFVTSLLDLLLAVCLMLFGKKAVSAEENVSKERKKK